MKKKVAIVYRLDMPGGVQSCVFSLIKGLNRMDIIPDILWDCEPDWSLMQEKGCRAAYRKVRFRVPQRMIDKMPNTLRYLAHICNVIDGRKFREEYDFFFIFSNGFVVSVDMPHVYYLSGPPLLPQLEEKSPGIKGLPVRFFRLLYKKALNRISPVFDYHRELRYVINSKFTASLFQDAHGVRLPVVYPPIDLSGRDFADDDLPTRDSITFFSRIVDYKRPEMVLDLARRHRQFRCVIMGAVSPIRRPYFERLREYADECRIQNVVFLDNPSSARVRDELARTRFYVFPGINEHFGMTTPEAIASGAIPFVHDSGGQREIVNNPELRFVDQTFFDRFEFLLKRTDAELKEARTALNMHVQKFSEANYIKTMLAYLFCDASGETDTKKRVLHYADDQG